MSDNTAAPAFYREEAQAPSQAPAPVYPAPDLAPQPPATYGTDIEILDIAVPKRERVHVPFRLSGDPHIYHFRAPKIAVMLLPVIEGKGAFSAMGPEMLSATLDWLGVGLSEDDNARILTRLKDSEDDLDMDTLNSMIQELASKVGKRPSS